MGVNLNSLRVQFGKQVFDTTKFKNLARGAALSKVRAAQEEMVEEFEAHRVTQELEGGPGFSGNSIINYFSVEGQANLYSFIGFKAGTDPVKLLRELLKKPIEVRLATRAKNSYFFRVLVPTTEQIEEATPMPDDYFAGDFSWARGVEDGDLLGIGQYLAIEAAASRSGKGIQVKIKTDSSIEATPYITDILEAFRRRLEELS